MSLSLYRYVYKSMTKVRDAIALLRMDDLYIDTFEVKDVKPLQGAGTSLA